MRVLGVDIGTTSLKATLVIDGKECGVWRSIHDCSSSNSSSRGVQNSAELLRKTLRLLHEVAAELDHDIDALAVCGQQHGVCTWTEPVFAVDGVYADISPLYTWEYDAVPQEFITEMRMETKTEELHGGYGCVTLAYLHSQNAIPGTHNAAGTIMDALVALLVAEGVEGLGSRPLISSHNAVSFGLSDGENWLAAATSAAWHDLLPRIRPPGTEAGTCRNSQVPARLRGCTVYVAMGDLQASIYPFLHPGVAVVNIGTSAQLCLLAGEPDAPSESAAKLRPSVRVDPFFDGRRVLVAASLNGGNVLDGLIDMLLGWTCEVSGNEAEKKRAKKASLLKLLDQESSSARPSTAVVSDGCPFGERGGRAPEGFALSHLTPDTRLISVLLATAESVIRNLLCLLPLPPSIVVVAAAGAASLNRFSRPLARLLPDYATLKLLPHEMSAAFGAALYTHDLLVRESHGIQ